jgi:hypothetical protein
MQFKAVLLALAITFSVAALPTDTTTARDTVVDEYGEKLVVRSDSENKKNETRNDHVWSYSVPTP